MNEPVPTIHASIAIPPPPPMPSSTSPSLSKSDKTRHGDCNPNADPQASRPLHLLISPPPPYTPHNAGRAHWRIMIPELGCTPLGPGKTIDVIGSPFDGYALRFTRDFDLHFENPRPTVLLLGEVPAGSVVDSKAPSGEDTDAIDELERIAKGVRAPGRSARPLDPYANDTCQAWTRHWVEALVREGILSPDALDVLKVAAEKYNSKPRRALGTS